ncbi:MAG: decaprenyl-phosphate phosphoribosyltransferase [Planctomycetota bacterium]|nr:MAG: decaprenyl-phosphate phosphoribosyltransferase [Planctomycetota bacterium]
MTGHATTPIRGEAAPFRDFLQLLRPTQWIKNVVVLAGPVAAKRLFHLEDFINAILAFVAFCLASSAAYAINDTIDRHADARHPTKRHRPLARGAIRPATALMSAAVLISASLALSVMFLNPKVIIILATYFVMVLGYSVALKNRILLDVIVIATGFVLRAWAGSEAVGVQTSEWLVACMFTLCLFLGFGKRRCELAMLNNEEDAREHRATLVRYTPDLLNHLITVSAGIAIITFLLYTMDRGPSPFDRRLMFYTLPIVFYGVFRYAMITELGIFAGPTEIILKDKGMRASILLWAAVALAIVYKDAVLHALGVARAG